MKISYERITAHLITRLHPRTRDILLQRFGLEKESSPQTLEAIGGRHGITRERVRQIMEGGLREVQESVREGKGKPELSSLFDLFQETLDRAGRLRREDLLLQELGAVPAASHVVFLLHVGDAFHRHRETEDMHAFWATHPAAVEEAPRLASFLRQEMVRRARLLSEEEVEALHAKLFATGKLAAVTSARPVLEVSKEVMKGYDGKWGLRIWPEVNPKGVREKSYLVLKNSQSPLHFREIAEKIQELQQQLSSGNAKPVLSQTVHNELIKDPRFVLVGRGIYALEEWGYAEGTVKDVLVAIVKAASKPLTRTEIVSKALQMRQVKESTILLNLQDRLLFERDEAGRYYLKS